MLKVQIGVRFETWGTVKLVDGKIHIEADDQYQAGLETLLDSMNLRNLTDEELFYSLPQRLRSYTWCTTIQDENGHDIPGTNPDGTPAAQGKLPAHFFER